MASIRFLGAAGTVTGSRFLLEHEGHRVLVDCGLFQGRKELRLRNWDAQAVDPSTVEAVVLTHAHIDHSGGLPRFVRDGFHGPIYCTSATRSLCGLLLPDSARIQEEEAAYANKLKYSRHSPALPLYTEADATRALELFETFGYGRTRTVAPGIRVGFRPAGHILGSAICVFDLESTGQRVVFTGDLGRYDAPILKDPEAVHSATTLVCESTYGDREHPADPMDTLARTVNLAVGRGGVLVIPAFAVGRTQDLLYRLRILEGEKRIPTLPVYVDSPMACDVTPLYVAHAPDHDFEMRNILADGQTPLRTERTRFVTSVAESKAINDVTGPAIIISASGMATGGRILHHLKHRLPDPRSTVLFVGYQSDGTRGHRLLSGETSVKIHGAFVEVKATIASISGFSAHADAGELHRWMDGFTTPPAQVLLVHGEARALEALRRQVAGRGWQVQVPEHLETVALAMPAER